MFKTEPSIQNVCIIATATFTHLKWNTDKKHHYNQQCILWDKYSWKWEIQFPLSGCLSACVSGGVAVVNNNNDDDAG